METGPLYALADAPPKRQPWRSREASPPSPSRDDPKKEKEEQHSQDERRIVASLSVEGDTRALGLSDENNVPVQLVTILQSDRPVHSPGGRLGPMETGRLEHIEEAFPVHRVRDKAHVVPDWLLVGCLN